MNTQYYTASSLDGFIATEDHSLDWLFQLGDVNQTSYPEFIQQVGALACIIKYPLVLSNRRTVR